MKSAKRFSGSFSKCIPGLLAGLLVLGSASISLSSLRTLGDKELSAVTGQSGVSIYEDIYTRVTMDTLQIYDSGGTNSVEFRNFTIDKDGTGAYFQIYTPVYYDAANDLIVDMPIELDVGTNTDGKTIVRLVDSSHMTPRTYTVDRFFFCGQELGYSDESNPATWSIRLAGLEHMQPDILHFSAHSSGNVGIDFDYSTQLHASSFQYNYNNASEAIKLSNIHLVNAADASHYDIDHNLIYDNPADPSTWSFTGDNQFQIGDIHNNVLSPASIDVGTNNADPSDTALFLNLPMKGSLRVGEVIFGTNTTSTDSNFNSNFDEGAPLNFGPIAIDGINAHHLIVKISTK